MNRIASKSSQSIGPMSKDIPTSKPLTGQSLNPLTSSAEDSPVKTCPLLENEQELMGLEADSGASMSDVFAHYDPVTSSWKTYQVSLLTQQWDEFSETWPRAGMMRNGRSFLLPTWEPHILERESGLWPTPDVVSAIHHGMVKTCGGQVHLPQAVNNPKYWPTPVSQEGGEGNDPSSRGKKLHIKVLKWPTPTARDYKHPGLPEKRLLRMEQRSQPLSEVIGGSLNPQWVEWLMGYPSGWTDLEVSATPSSRKS